MNAPTTLQWLAKKAADQACINARYPLHARAYPSWVQYVKVVNRLIGELK